MLNSRARLVPVSTLEPKRRAELEAGDDDFIAGVLGAPAASLLISSELAELVELFRRPATLHEAMSRLAGRRGLEVDAILEAGEKHLRELIARGVLSAVDGASSRASPPLYAPGDRPVDGCRIIRPIHHLAGSEVYLVRLDDGRRAAFKIEPHPAGKGELEREVDALKLLGGTHAPELYASGRLEGRPWLLRGWVDGAHLSIAGRSARREDQALGAGGIRLLELLRRVARAFADVHERGVLHGDVHDGNVLIDANGKAWLIDFALSSRCRPTQETSTSGTADPDGGTDAQRAGSLLFVEPEQARALLDGRGSVPVTPRGEQFAVGALLYEAACGVPYMEFRLDRASLLGQIAQAEPLPFAHHGLDPWPALESILGRALAADKEERFPHLRELAEALDRLPPLRRRRRSRHRLPVVARRLRRRLRLLTRIDEDVGPSIYDGAAGVSYALLRLAGQLERPSALATAETWLDEAKRRPVGAAKEPRVGRISPFHTHAGVAVVDALLGHALGDGQRLERAIALFLERSRPAAEPELMLGRGGSLLAACMLRELEPGEACRRTLAAVANGWANELLYDQDTRGALHEATYWGMAHGWAGELYALLRWFDGAGRPIPPRIVGRLAELAELERPRGRGAIWPQPGGGPLSGWCHGGAGYVYLWHAAATIVGGRNERRRFHALAERAAWDAYEGPGEDGTLCCGLVGRAWSLLHHARRCGEEIWLHRASALAEKAARATFPDPATSLFKGELALVLLDAELHGVEKLGFPFLAPDPAAEDADRRAHEDDVLEEGHLLDVAGGSAE